MNKLTMAHELAMKIIEGNMRAADARDLVERAWQYADAMQAEADKRNKSEAEQKRKEIREMLNAPNTFIEREGQHFDDVEEWQPDWSQAPDNLVQYFAVDESGRGGWFITKPKLCSDHWYWSDWSERDENDHYDHAQSFGYTGNWKDSLRKRPEHKCEVDWGVAPEWARYWAIREDSNTALWCINKPTATDDCLLSHGGCSPAPSFGFTGTHIVERPHGF